MTHTRFVVAATCIYLTCFTIGAIYGQITPTKNCAGCTTPAGQNKVQACNDVYNGAGINCPALVACNTLSEYKGMLDPSCNKGAGKMGCCNLTKGDAVCACNCANVGMTKKYGDASDNACVPATVTFFSTTCP